MIERGKRVVCRDISHAQRHEIKRENAESEQIRTLADYQAEIRKHEFQADCDRRRIQKMN